LEAKVAEKKRFIVMEYMGSRREVEASAPEGAEWQELIKQLSEFDAEFVPPALVGDENIAKHENRPLTARLVSRAEDEAELTLTEVTDWPYGKLPSLRLMCSSSVGEEVVFVGAHAEAKLAMLVSVNQHLDYSLALALRIVFNAANSPGEIVQAGSCTFWLEEVR
jgi:hypothetical protein